VLRSPHPHARIVSIDTIAAEAHPKVKAVITGETLAARNLAWMPTLSGDTQAVLATDKVRFQGQEVAFVVAEDRYSARDALELIDVDYEPLPAVVDARRAMDPGAPLVRDDLAGRTGNHVFDWEAGDAGRTEQVFRDAEITVTQDMLYPRVHPAPLETCGAVADFAGNVSAASSLAMQVDASAPSLAIVCPATATVGQSGVHATVTASDAQSGLAVDPSGSVPIDTAKAGSVTIERTASDNVGHSTTSSCTTDIENTQTITGSLKKKLIVKSGEAVELTSTAKAKAIEVQSGGALDVEGASTGGIKASGASQIRICAATVSGASKLTGTSGSVVAGDEAGCDGSSFKSGLTVTAGSGTVTVIGDQFGAKLTVTHNSGSATTVTHNTVGKALTVTANSGTVIDAPNSVKGKTKVQ